MSTKTRKIAVLTGDLVNSTGLGPEKVERAFRALEGCAEMQADWMGGQSLHFTRHRGDGWQVALMEPKYALRSALCFRAALRALGEEFESYFGIAEGEVEGEIGPNLNEKTAKVFLNSGMELEDIKNTQIGTYISFDKDTALNGLACLADDITHGWTPIQAKAVSLLLEIGPMRRLTKTDLSLKLGKSRQTISKSLEAARYAKLIQALESAELSE